MALLCGLAARVGAGARGTRPVPTAVLGLSLAGTKAGTVCATAAGTAGITAGTAAGSAVAGRAGGAGVMLLPLSRTEPERRTEHGRMACRARGDSGSSGGDGMVMGLLRMLQGEGGERGGRVASCLLAPSRFEYEKIATTVLYLQAVLGFGKQVYRPPDHSKLAARAASVVQLAAQCGRKGVVQAQPRPQLRTCTAACSAGWAL